MLSVMQVTSSLYKMGGMTISGLALLAGFRASASKLKP